MRSKLIVIAFLLLAPIGTAQTPTRADNWDPLRSLVGIWEGTGNGQPGEMLRVAKREGMLSFAVWDKGELNPFSYLITDILARHFGDATPADPNAPGAFRFADHGSLARILA